MIFLLQNSGLKINDIINPFASKIKNNQLNLEDITKEEIITLMIDEPILIKRPLLEIGENKLCGFDIEKINQLLGTTICEHVKISVCQSEASCTNV